MHRRNVLLLIGGALAAPLVLSTAAQACGPEREFQKPVRFAPGAHEVRIQRTIKSDATHEWVLTGKPGQRVEIVLHAKKTSFSLSPDLAAKGEHRWGNAMQSALSTRKWTGTLPKTGRMLIDIQTAAARENYALVVKMG